MDGEIVQKCVISFFVSASPCPVEATFGTGPARIFFGKIHQSFEPVECYTVKMGLGGGGGGG